MGTPYAEVIGDPVAHSKSPLIHKFWLEALGLPGDYRATRVTRDDLPAYFEARRADPDWRGCNVTMPLKRAVLDMVDEVSPDAEAIGAVNIVARRGARLVGHNSDGAGFLEPLRPWLAERHLFRMARVFGAGGAARAIAHALAGEGFTLVVGARDVGQAEALIAKVGGEHHAVSLDHFAPPTDFAFDDRKGLLDLVVNATPLGAVGQPPLGLDWSHVPPGSIIYDIVTGPVETALLIEAQRRGHDAIDGLRMLVGQADAAFRLFFGSPAPREHDAELRRRLLA